VCTAAVKGRAKHARDRVVLRAAQGIEGDAHAGAGHRQVSMLAEDDIAMMRARGLELAHGAFGENLVIGELALAELGIGSRLALGEAEIEVTQLGKECHDPCAISRRAGVCIMPQTGIFAVVLKGGSVRPGDEVQVRTLVPRSVMQAAVLTISDSAAEGRREDTAGPAVARLLEQHEQLRLAWAGVVPDDASEISEQLTQLASRGLDLVATTGGTGCGPRDATPEATRAVIEREVPGLAEAMRISSAGITPHAWLQRGVCGIRRSTLIVNLPGSPKAAVENLAAIMPAIPHAVQLLRGNTGHSQEPPSEFPSGS